MSKAIKELSDIIEDVGYLYRSLIKMPYLAHRYNRKSRKAIYSSLLENYEYMMEQHQNELKNCEYRRRKK